MQAPFITIIMNGSTYKLNPADKTGIANLPLGDRKQLITLLEAIEQSEQQRHDNALQAERKANASAALASNRQDTSQRPDTVDADQLFAQLAMEDKNSKKPGLSKQSVYKWTGISMLLLILLVLIF